MRTSSSLSSEVRILAGMVFGLFLLNALINSAIPIDLAKICSSAEWIDSAESQKPKTHLAWERARAQAATLDIN